MKSVRQLLQNLFLSEYFFLNSKWLYRVLWRIGVSHFCEMTNYKWASCDLMELSTSETVSILRCIFLNQILFGWMLNGWIPFDKKKNILRFAKMAFTARLFYSMACLLAFPFPVNEIWCLIGAWLESKQCTAHTCKYRSYSCYSWRLGSKVRTVFYNLHNHDHNHYHYSWISKILKFLGSIQLLPVH